MSGKKVYNLALIGAGRMGERWAKVIAAAKTAALRTVIDKDLMQAKKVAAAQGAEFSKNEKDALGENIDAVFIAVPHKFLYPLACAALLSGKHVFVEKPGSRTAKEMNELIKIAARKRLRLMVGFNYRSFDSIRRAKRIVESGAIGEVQFIRVRHGYPGRPGFAKEWRMNRDLAAGGALMDQGLHVLDLVNWFFGEQANKVAGMTSNNFWKSEVEDNAFVLLQTPRGKTASVHVSVTEWKPIFFMEIFGEKGYCIIPGLGRKYGDGTKITIGTFDHKKQTLKERVIACDPDADRALYRELQEFMRAIREQREPSPGARDALAVLKKIEKVYEQRA